jgi:6,7-dimethyl-8-ribityllumazine synthase
MAGRGSGGFEVQRLGGASGHHVLIIEAPYYADVAEALAEGAIAELEAFGATYERVVVPGALEIPQALRAAAGAGLIPMTADHGIYTGAIVLGCVIRGETSHYDIVCNSANHWLMDTATRYAIPVGNAILTVDTHDQAMVRAGGGRDGKGGDAARACLQLAELGGHFVARSKAKSTG